MIGGRQLPSWMLKSNAADQPSVSGIKAVNKEDDSEAVDDKDCKRQTKIQRKQHDTLLENKSRLLKKCEARSKIRFSKQDEDQGVSVDESDEGKKVNVKAGKESQQRDEGHLLYKCEKSRRKRMSNKQPHEQNDDLCEDDMEDKTDIAARKRRESNAPRRKKNKEKDFMEGSHDGIIESIASDDELTVEDLISIAEEYVIIEKEELQKLQNVGFESEIKPLHKSTSKSGPEKHLSSYVESRIPVTDKPLSTNSSVMKPLLSKGSIINPISTGDPARDMLDLFLGPLLKTSGEMEREAEVRTEKLMLNYELSQRSQNDTELEVVPATEKKRNLKDKVAMLLD